MCSQAVEFCLAACEYDVTERDRVKGQRSKEKVGRFERGKCDFNSTVNHPGGGTEQKCWRHEAQTNRSAGRGKDIARDASSEMDTAHCEYLTTRLGILSCGINGIFGMAGLVLQSSTPSRSSMAVGSKTVVRYGRPAGKRAALSPKTGEKAVADQDDIGWPFGMLREYSLLGVDAVDQRRPMRIGKVDGTAKA